MRNGKWMLLAEDNSCDADLTIRALSDEEYPCEVVVARDGAEALDCLMRRGAFETRRHGDPALILLDLKMPRVDGLEVLRQIKAHVELRTIPVVVFSSSKEESDLTRSYQLGANAYVVKPVDFRKFTSALQTVRTFWLTLNELPPERGGKTASRNSSAEVGRFHGAPPSNCLEPA